MFNWPEINKYVRRFGLAATVAVSMFFLHGLYPKESLAGLLTYKIGIVIVALGLCELCWAIFFKPDFGKTEDTEHGIASEALVIGRFILYGLVVHAVATGL